MIRASIWLVTFLAGSSLPHPTVTERCIEPPQSPRTLPQSSTKLMPQNSTKFSKNHGPKIFCAFCDFLWPKTRPQNSTRLSKLIKVLKPFVRFCGPKPDHKSAQKVLEL